MFDALCRALAHHSRAHVVSVGYSLAPEHKFPGGLQDAYAATSWASEHAADFGADPSRIAVAGECTMTAHVVLKQVMLFGSRAQPTVQLKSLAACSKH